MTRGKEDEIKTRGGIFSNFDAIGGENVQKLQFEPIISLPLGTVEYWGFSQECLYYEF